MKKLNLPKEVWLEIKEIKGTSMTSLILTRSKVWGFNMGLDPKEYAHYRLVRKRKPRKPTKK